ncbi:hypothetical protein ATKI12_0352 [Kitasatospora sp. Ki12]
MSPLGTLGIPSPLRHGRSGDGRLPALCAGSRPDRLPARKPGALEGASGRRTPDRPAVVPR